MLFSYNYCARYIVLAAVLLLVPAINAGTVPFGTWQQFSFQTLGTPAAGCDPADPAGDFCFPSSGTPSQFLDAPPWTFTVPTAGAFLSVTDAFTSGERFELFNGSTSLGLTYAPGTGTDCGDDPAICLATSGMSSARLLLTAGSYSLTIVPTAGEAGSGFLLVSDVPEPGSIALLALGAFAFAARAFSARRQEVRQ